MCSAPKVPKAPKVKQINPYQSYQDDPEFYRKAKELGINNIDKSHEIRKIKDAMFWDRIAQEEKDYNYIIARDQLLEEGIIDPFYGKDGTLHNPIRNEQLLQKVFDRMNDNEQKRFTEESNEAFAAQNKEMQEMFNKLSKENIEAMRMPTPKQAPPPPVQAPTPEFKAPPPTPATPFLENIPSAPAPVLVDSDPYRGGIIRTRGTARQQRSQATSGTSSLRITKSKAIKSPGLNIPR